MQRSTERTEAAAGRGWGWRTAVAGAALLLAGGCARGTAEFVVAADGSGSLHVRVLAAKDGLQRWQALAAMLQAMGLPAGPLGGLAPQPGGGAGMPIGRADFEQLARDLGGQVKLVDVKRLAAGNDEGVEANYTFSDVRKVRWNGVDPSGRPDGTGLRFDFQPGETALLKASPFGLEGRAGGAAVAREASPLLDPMLKSAFAGLRLRLTLRVDGRILRTAASRVEGGSTVVLADVDAARMRPADLLSLLQVRDLAGAVRLQRAHLPGVHLEDCARPLAVMFR